MWKWENIVLKMPNSLGDLYSFCKPKSIIEIARKSRFLNHRIPSQSGSFIAVQDYV